jgi:coenzyme PQQ synthesis protein D (PqqD)
VSEARIMRRRDALWRATLDSVLVVPPGAGEPITLAGTAPCVWEAIEHAVGVDELVETLATRFGAARGVVRGDVVPLLEHLVELGVAERVA